MLHHMLRAAAQRAFQTLDPYFKYVTMLLHGDGSALGSDTVTPFNSDASTNAFNVTINGDARANNFNPYQAGYYSNSFDGNGDYLDLADNAGFSVTPEEMLDQVYAISRQADPSGAANKSAADSITRRLVMRRDAPELLKAAQARADIFMQSNLSLPQDLVKEIDDLTLLSKPLRSEDFDEFIKNFQEAKSDNASSGKSRDVFANKIASGLSRYRRNVFNSIDTKLPNGQDVNVGDLFSKYADEVETRQKYNNNLLGGILKEAGGEQSTNPRAIVAAVMREPETIKKVVQSLRELEVADPTKAGQTNKILGLLQLEYMNEIGIKPSLRGKGARSIKADENIVRTLFGGQADAQLRAIADLNNNLKNIGDLGSSCFASNCFAMLINSAENSGSLDAW